MNALTGFVTGFILAEGFGSFSLDYKLYKHIRTGMLLLVTKVIFKDIILVKSMGEEQRHQLDSLRIKM